MEVVVTALDVILPAGKKGIISQRILG